MATDRLLFVVTSPRLPAGLLSWPAWQALRAGPVFAADPDADQARAVAAAGIAVSRLDPAPDGAAGSAAALRERARGGRVVVWLAGPDGDPELAGALAALAATDPGVDSDVVSGSWDPPGARLLDVVAVVDRLRSPGGCPWDAAQTHQSLMPYLLEEAYEAYQALEDDDLTALREELGDVLFQVAIHARLAEEAAPGWSVDDVADDLVAKLVRRHPHVFAGAEVAGADGAAEDWEQIKRAEKGRTSVTEGVPLAQPALSLAAALQRRAARAGLPDTLPDSLPERLADEDDRTGLGRRLFDLVGEARRAGQDPEAALRAVCRAYRDTLLAAEQADSP